MVDTVVVLVDELVAVAVTVCVWVRVAVADDVTLDEPVRLLEPEVVSVDVKVGLVLSVLLSVTDFVCDEDVVPVDVPV